MADIFQNPTEAYAEIDNRLKKRIEEDDALALDLDQLSDEDLAEVRTKWNEKQRKEMRIQTSTRTQKTPISAGAAFGAASRGGGELVKEVDSPTLRPLYDQGTEQFLEEWAEAPEVFDFQSARQEELEGATSLLLQAFPDRAAEILPQARARAKAILDDRGVRLFPEAEEEGGAKQFSQEFTRRALAFAEGAGAGPVTDAMEGMLRNPPLYAYVPDFPRATKEEAADAINRVTPLSADNRRLSALAYGNDTALLTAAGTGLAWMGGANAIFRGNLGGRLVAKTDEAGAKILDKAGNQVMRRDVRFAIDPLSRKGLGVGLGADAASGAAFGPEYAPSVVAEMLGMEPSRLTSAVESGAFGLAAGTVLRALSNQAMLTRVRNMPGMEDLKDLPNKEFAHAAVDRMQEMWETQRRAAAARAGRGEQPGPRETGSMGAEFVDDMPATVAREAPERPVNAARTTDAGTDPRPTATGQVASLKEAPGSSEVTTGKPQHVLPEKKVKGLSKRAWFGPLPDGSLDILNVIEDLGGIRSPRAVSQTGGEYDGFAEVLNQGPGRMLVSRSANASTVDQLLSELPALGFTFDSADDLYHSIERALTHRRRVKAEMQFQENRDIFMRTALDNQGGRRKTQRPDPSETLATDELTVGSEFKIKGEPVVVRDIDPDTGAAVVDDGPRFGSGIELPPGHVLHPDKGSLKKVDGDTAWPEPEPKGLALERATPAQNEADKARLADIKAKRKQAEEIERRQLAPLEGDSSGVGQGRLFEGDEDLFSGASAASAARGPTQHATGSPFKDSVPPPTDILPDWVKMGGETQAGRQIISGIERAGKKPDFGPRSIVDYVNDAVNVEMRKSRSQTSKKHPAHYRPVGHVTFTRSGLRQYNFHEAGHGLKELIEARAKGFFDAEPVRGSSSP